MFGKSGVRCVLLVGKGEGRGGGREEGKTR